MTAMPFKHTVELPLHHLSSLQTIPECFWVVHYFILLIQFIHQVSPGVYLCGDHRGTATLNGAIESGKSAARLLLSNI